MLVNILIFLYLLGIVVIGISVFRSLPYLKIFMTEEGFDNPAIVFLMALLIIAFWPIFLFTPRNKEFEDRMNEIVRKYEED